MPSTRLSSVHLTDVSTKETCQRARYSTAASFGVIHSLPIKERSSPCKIERIFSMTLGDAK
jgi:hypothetical protein